MLEHVDTVLSFAVVMLLLSLLITGLVQIVVVLLVQRRAVLKLGIERLLKQIAPGLNDTDAAAVARAVLRHPALSLGRSPRASGPENAATAPTTPPTAPTVPATAPTDPPRAPIVPATATTDSPTASTDSAQGAADKGSLTAILEFLMAVLKFLMAMVNSLTAILKGPTAIKKEELIHVLRDLPTSAAGSLSPTANDVLQDLTKTNTPSELEQAANNLNDVIDSKFPKEAATIKEFVKRTIAPPCKLARNVDTWFDTVIDRTTDQFQHRTRWITIVFAVVLAFVFHVDSLKILHQLSSDAQTRAELVQMAGAAMRKAETLIPMSTNPALTAIQQACTDCAAEKPAIPAISSRISNELTAHDKVIAWVNKTLDKQEDRDKLIATFEKRYKEALGPGVRELIESTSQIKTTLDGSKLIVFQTPLPAWKESLGLYRDPKDHYTHFWGTLMTAFFLSLGAPFWYNALKQLSNLRPAIAQKADLASQPKE